MKLGEILSELREDRGLTQRELSEQMHISNSSISAYETGVRMPSLETLKEMAGFYDVTTDYLLGLTAAPLSPAVLNEEVVRGVTKSTVLKMIDALTPSQKEALLLVLEGMKFYTEIRDKTAQDGAEKK